MFHSMFFAVGSPAVIELLPDKLTSVLIPDQGYHQVGPTEHCTDTFVLSVTVAFATKLEQVKKARDMTRELLLLETLSGHDTCDSMS